MNPAKKPEKKKKTTASFVSLGCFKNLVDSEVLGGMLEKRGVKIVSAYEDADWIIINTCGFIRDAKAESIDEILAALEQKESGEFKRVAVFGCLIERYPEELKLEFPGVDILWGVNDLEKLADLIAANRAEDYRSNELFLYTDGHRRIITTPPNVAFIKISEGCGMKCSFCSIPRIRGPFRSRPIDSIMREAQRYREMGFQELNLISQNSTSFGRDRSSRSQLPDLLKEISRLDFPAVRVLYLMPEEVTDEVLDGFSYPSIIPYFDLPFQHVSPRVLQAMNRGGSVEKNRRLVEKIRAKYRGAVIRSSFIVGFPGETAAEFQELVDFARRLKIERIGVFGFSPEEGTAAFDLQDRVPDDQVELRKELLMDVSDRNITLYNKKIVQSIQDFLPLAPWQNETTIGRIASQAPDTDGLTCIPGPFDEDYRMRRIKITGFSDELVFGEKV